ncbi:ATP-binding protein [Calycomorphotria hydatis]|uniref:histidine kinase n=1 Tax=Calycomorphotria hydatis TaxID=2528027 RepID=A0A517T8Z8_9PLAN|nr:ATP-binding protein [Calycomorphotria hydatis]QDT64828.1 Sensor histidine kinase RegB [Calycomorphotria hydatis]
MHVLNLLLGRPQLNDSQVSVGGFGPLAGNDFVRPLAGTASWLVQLRWVATLGQLITVSSVRWVLGVDIPLTPLFITIAVTALSNIPLAIWSATHPPGDPATEPSPIVVRVCGPVMLLDLALLTALLFFTGGPANPFVVFYFVNLSLTTVVLTRRWAWAATVVALSGLTLIAIYHWPLDAVQSEIRFPPFSKSTPGLIQSGMLVAFFACAVVIVYFTTLLREQLQRHEDRLRAVRDEFARAQKLEALGTLAAGAAHELANPLATIAVVSRELQIRVERQLGEAEDEKTARDFELIHSELETCRSILDRMSLEAGEAMGEKLAEVTVEELVQEVVVGLRNAERVAVEHGQGVADLQISVPLVVLAQAIRGLVQNAIAASPESTGVTIRSIRKKNWLEFQIEDIGEGMSPEVLARVGDPFFTTKEPGSGTGLGVFLARAVVERLGGGLDIRSVPGEGTTVRVQLPLNSYSQ